MKSGAWSEGLLGLLALVSEGECKWNSDVTHSVWQQEPQLGLLQEKRA